MPAYDRLYSLLRLACKTGNGYLPERQNAFEKVLAHALKHSIDLPRAIYELRINLDGLQHPFKIPEPQVKHTFSKARAETTYRSSRSEPIEIHGIYPVAGFQYYEGPRLRSLLRVGQAVTLQALTTNRYDPFAVAVFYGDLMIGYVPRQRNQRIWAYLREGGSLSAIISGIRPSDGYGAVEIQIQKTC